MADDKAPERIWRAVDAEQIAKEELIPTYHQDLIDARVLFLMTTKERKSAGKLVWAKTTKLTGAAKFLSSSTAEEIDDGYDFQVLISAEVWDRLSSKQRKALIDHELSHCVGTVTDDGYKWSMRAHEVEEFTDVLKRNGAWHDELKEFAETLAQLPLFAEAR